MNSISKVRAERLRREWLRWVTANLPSMTEPPDVEVQEKLIALRRISVPHGHARNYEHCNVTPEAIISALMAALEARAIVRVLIIVGDSSAPAVFEINVKDVESLLRHAVLMESTVSMSSLRLDGSLCLDISDCDGRCDFMVTARGSIEGVIGTIARLIPGGTEFRGN